MYNLIRHVNGLRFENIYLYPKTSCHEKYVLLNKIIDGIRGLNLIIFSKGEQVIKPNLALKNSIFIFHNVILDNQSPNREFFTSGRHYGTSSILCMTKKYSKIKTVGVK
ncbi:Uncharacterized protein FWK35_00024505 [Aphis craccivora]|uniref:Uncharacterized protein n=1 Tax=Aphis craccivora TaxID=307492 RepID=A0A6G0VX50_APHCR|nr:Uncharacterized protein FWK35_00024505 [Aphis craccivora]